MISASDFKTTVATRFQRSDSRDSTYPSNCSIRQTSEMASWTELRTSESSPKASLEQIVLRFRFPGRVNRVGGMPRELVSHHFCVSGMGVWTNRSERSTHRTPNQQHRTGNLISNRSLSSGSHLSRTTT